MRPPPRLTEFPKYPITAGVAILAIAITVLWWFKLPVSELFATAMIRRGELWRLITCMLPHAGILHLAFNVYWLWVFGTIIEEVFGHLRSAAFILLFALISGAMEFALAAGGIGLSGVGYGFFGLLWVLSSHDERFHDAVDRRTVELFVGWFIFCILTTVMKVFAVANIAHATGAAVGALTGFAISVPRRRAPAAGAIAALLIFGLWGATLGRPRINLSSNAGYEEGKWGYDALVAGRNQEAARWLGDAVFYRPKSSVYWFDFGIALQRLGDAKAARAAYQRAHELEPGNSDYLKAADALP